jgi:peptide deformylase
MSEVEGQVREEEELDVEAEARRRLALAQIRQYPDPALRLEAREIVDFDGDLARLVERMTELMHDAQGVGLAATQVGVLRRLFVFVPDEDGPRAVVNPRIVDRGSETETEVEGCLSLQGVRVPVERVTRVTLAGRDTDGSEVRWELEGLSARVVQHELDHLDGVLIVDRTDPESRKEALGILRPQPILR